MDIASDHWRQQTLYKVLTAWRDVIEHNYEPLQKGIAVMSGYRWISHSFGERVQSNQFLNRLLRT